MPCEVTLYSDNNFGGKSLTVTESTPDLDETSMGVGKVSSYKVNADEECLITAWKGRDYTGEGRYLRGNETDLGQRRKWNDDNWNDNIDAIKIERIPSAKDAPDEYIEYHLNVPYYLPASPYDTHCGGCRWWPKASPFEDADGNPIERDPKDANMTNVVIGEYTKYNEETEENEEHMREFQPCPGGLGKFNSKSGVKCGYSKKNGSGLATLLRSSDKFPGDPRRAMWDELSTQFCNEPENVKKNMGEPCLSRVRGADQVKNYCVVDDRMQKDYLCSRENLGEHYDEAAQEFCNANPKNKWCSCYNVKAKVCDTNMEAAGCEFIKFLEDNQNIFGPRIEKMVPGENPGDPPVVGYDPPIGYNILRDNAHCTKQMCNDGYIPTGFDSDCKKSYRFCKRDINIKTSSANDIAILCNIDMTPIILPDWWGKDKGFERKPPFDRFPLNRLPITEWPEKFDMKNRDAKNIVYYGSSGAVVLCLICIIMLFALMTALKTRRRG
jgi:hypothetical protein